LLYQWQKVDFGHNYLVAACAMTWFQNGFAKIRIIETTKLYIAMDSIIANPTNNVRVIVFEASGCWASELSADATAQTRAYAADGDCKPGGDDGSHRDESHVIHNYFLSF
jgi:hypothetical protein